MQYYLSEMLLLICDISVPDFIYIVMKKSEHSFYSPGMKRPWAQFFLCVWAVFVSVTAML